MAQLDRIERLLDKVGSYMESGDSPYEKESLIYAKQKFSKAKVEECNKQLKRIQEFEESGMITPEYASEMTDYFAELAVEAECDANPAYFESVVGKGLEIALTEVAKFAGKLFAQVPASIVGTVITLPVRKFIMARLDKYRLLFPDAVAFKQLTSERYALDEIRKKFNVKMAYADKWQEKGLRVDSEVYSYNDKPVMMISWTKHEKNFVDISNLEVEFMDGRFRKHEDYYTSCMATKLQLSHPCVKRLLTKMKKMWERECTKQKYFVKESVSEAIINGTLDDKIEAIYEATETGLMDEDTKDMYLGMVKKSMYEI